MNAKKRKEKNSSIFEFLYTLKDKVKYSTSDVLREEICRYVAMFADSKTV